MPNEQDQVAVARVLPAVWSRIHSHGNHKITRGHQAREDTRDTGHVLVRHFTLSHAYSPGS